MIEGQAEDITPVAEVAPAAGESPAFEAASMPERLTDTPLVSDPEVEPATPHDAGPEISADVTSPTGSRASDQDGPAYPQSDTSQPAAPPSYDMQGEQTAKPRSSLWGTLAALGFVVLAAGLLYLFSQISSLPPDTSAAVADLKSRVAAIEARPASDAAGMQDRVAKLDGGLTELRGNVEALDKRFSGLAEAASKQPNVTDQVAGLQSAVTDLKTALAALTSNVAAIPRVDLGPVESRIGDLDRRLVSLQSSVSSIPHVDLGPLTGKVDAIETRLKPIEAEVDASRSPEQVAQRRAAPVAVTAQAIMGALESNQAFPKELQALQVLGADPARLAPLQAVAETGAPSLRDLQASLSEVRDRIVAQGAAPASGSYVDRLMAGASNLVQVRPLGSVVGDTPAAIVARMNDEIGHDDLAAALADWHKLPEASQGASKDLAARLKLRLDAEQAARGIAANAIGAMAPPRG